MSTFTTAKGLEQVARGGDVGTWDTPTNSNWGIVDAALGQFVVIGLNNSNVTLSAAQFQCNSITFNSTLTGNVAIIFPSSFLGPYQINNLCTGTSAFTVTLQTTGGFQVVGCPPGAPFDVWNFGSSNGGIVLSKAFGGAVGTYADYAGSSLPNWISACSPQPYLNCDGTAFSSATFPALATILGGNTLPDSRGRFRATLNQTTGRITSGSSTGGVDGNTLLASGGGQTVTLSSLNMPQIKITDLGHTHNVTGGFIAGTGTALAAPGSGSAVPISLNNVTIVSNFTGISAGNASPTNFSNLPPAYIGGITMIRAG